MSRSREIAFVPAAEADAPVIAALRREIWGTAYRGIYPDEAIDARDLARIRDEGMRVYVIRCGAAPVGYFSFTVTPRVHIASLYVLPAYRRQGAGRAAVAIARGYCRERGIPSFTCRCNEHNAPARRFYARMGGTVIGTDSGHANRQEDQVTYGFDA